MSIRGSFVHHIKYRCKAPYTSFDIDALAVPNNRRLPRVRDATLLLVFSHSILGILGHKHDGIGNVQTDNGK